MDQQAAAPAVRRRKNNARGSRSREEDDVSGLDGVKKRMNKALCTYVYRHLFAPPCRTRRFSYSADPPKNKTLIRARRDKIQLCRRPICVFGRAGRMRLEEQRSLVLCAVGAVKKTPRPKIKHKPKPKPEHSNRYR